MSNFGQLVAIFDFANRGIAIGVDAAIESKRIRGETKLGKLRIFQQGDLLRMDREIQRELMRSKIATSARRDVIFKEIALYAGLGIGAIILIITLGVFLTKK